MDAWIYLFSKVTPAALWYELMAILALLTIYSAYWIVKKRRLGTMDQVVPAGLVRTYLNELIGQSQLVRNQLFGLLSQAGVAAPQGLAFLGEPAAFQAAAAPAATAPQVAEAAVKIANDPELLKKMKELEDKVTNQNKAVDSLMTEKKNLEAELAKAKSQAQDGGGGKADPELKTKLKELEERLSEYAVIEDDLANLKRLQQENARLKEALAKGGGSVPPAEAAPEAAPPAPAAAAPAPAPTPEPAPAPTPAPEAAPTEADLAKLNEQVEKTIQETAKAAAPEPAPEPAAPAPAPAPAPEPAPVAAAPAATAATAATAAAPAPAAADSQPQTLGKSDEDLLAEFEKMLNM